MMKILLIIEFIGFYLFNLVKSNLLIAYDILTPVMRSTPAFITIPLRLKTDAGLLLFSNLVSMTPGSLSYEITEDRKQLVVHILYMNSKEKMIEDIEKIQDKILKIAS
jgi:multicomponent Na+:H+ antiporter subunit E